VGDQDRGLALAPQISVTSSAEREASLGIECREWLVQQHHVGLGGQRAGERDALAHAAGELARQVVQNAPSP